MSDNPIIKKLKHNNEKAIEELIDKYGQYIASVVFRIGGSSLKAEDIEEVISDVFYAVWKTRDTIVQTDSLKPYIAQIARNITRNRFKNQRDELPIEEELLLQEDDKIEEMLVQKEKVSIIKDFVDTMKYPDKDILTDYYFKNYKLQDISANYKIPMSTVKSKIYRGRKTIIKYLEERGYIYEF